MVFNVYHDLSNGATEDPDPRNLGFDLNLAACLFRVPLGPADNQLAEYPWGCGVSAVGRDLAGGDCLREGFHAFEDLLGSWQNFAGRK